MSFTEELSFLDVQQKADLVVEGTIAYKYRDFIPGKYPLQRGIHWLFDVSSSSVWFNLDSGQGKV